MSTEQISFLSGVLQNTLNPDKTIRKQAEDTLKQLRTQPQFTVMLLQFIISDIPPESQKQSAAVYFKNLTGNHWSPQQDDFHIADTDKVEVRRVIVDCMIASKSTQLRTILSDAIAKICEFDFPTHWPAIVVDLVNKLQATSDLQTITGVLYTAHSIFKRYRLEMELRRETQQEILKVIQEFAPTMIDLFEKLIISTSQPNLSKETLEQLIHNVNLLIELYYDLNCLDISDWFLANMSRFMNLFLKCMQLNFPVLASADDERPGLLDQTKAVVIQCITLCLEKFDEDFQPFVENFTVAIWDLLQTLSVAPKHDELCIAAMAFLTGISRTIYHKLLADSTKQKMICEKIIIPNMELRSSDTEMFEDDSQEYIRRDIEGSDSDTRRRAACDLIQGLSKNYEAPISEIFQQYVQFLLQQFSLNPNSNWKFKDTAIYLITALSVRGTTSSLQQKGTTRVNNLVNIGDFCTQHIIPELQDSTALATKFPILKADAIKFITSFRVQLPKESLLAVLRLLLVWVQHPSVVVHSYAAAAFERILMVREPLPPNLTGAIGYPTVPPLRLQKEDWKDLAGPILQNLFQTLLTSKQENEYVMKAVMRVILCGQENVSLFVPHIIPLLCKVLFQVATNPRYPAFNHFLFEAIAGLIKYNPTQLDCIEQSVFPIFAQILSSENQEFLPYIFQILAVMLEMKKEIPPNYMQLFTPLLTPSLYENKGNIPGIIRLLKVYLEKAPQQMIQHLTSVLGVFQFLISSRVHDHEGFNLLNTIITYIPQQHFMDALRTILNVLLTRLMSSRTTKFVRCLLLFFSLFCYKLTADLLISTLEQLQPNSDLWRQVYVNVWLREVGKVFDRIPRKLCILALTRILANCQWMVQLAATTTTYPTSPLTPLSSGTTPTAGGNSTPPLGFIEIWGNTLLAILKLLEFGVEQETTNDGKLGSLSTSVPQDRLEEGYMNVYCPLAAAVTREDDPAAEITDVNSFFTNTLRQCFTSNPAYHEKCVVAMKSLPPEVITRLQQRGIM